jgi:hypothetical protein
VDAEEMKIDSHLKNNVNDSVVNTVVLVSKIEVYLIFCLCTAWCISDVCHQPLETGPCDQWTTRYHYESHSRRCEPFTYGGCEGNGNRFISQTECESTCSVQEQPEQVDIKGMLHVFFFTKSILKL